MKNEINADVISKKFIPGLPVDGIEFSNSTGKITFEDKRPCIPLPPLVEAHLSILQPGQKQYLKVNTVFFIDAAKEVHAGDFKVYQEFSISDSGESRLQFFISYDVTESKAKEFRGYQISFKIWPDILPQGINLTNVTTIQTFLWDTDPVSSRGTVTNVQS